MRLSTPSSGSAPLQTDLPALASWVALFEAKRLAVVADTTAVSTWTDSSGNGRDATQTGSARPIYKVAANGINSQPVLRFTAASSQFMKTAAGGASLTSSFYACALVKFNGIADYQQILCWGDDLTGKRRAMLFYQSTNQVGWNGQSADITPGGPGSTAGPVYFFEIIRSGTTIKVYQNGVETSSGTPSLNAYAANVLRIGTNNGEASEYLNGDLAMCGFIGSAPDSIALSRIRGYVRDVYGVTFPAGPANDFATVYPQSGLATVSGFFDAGATAGQAGVIDRQFVAFCKGRTSNGFGVGHMFVVDDAGIGPAIFQNLNVGGYGAVDFWDATVGKYAAGSSTKIAPFGCGIGWGNVGCTPAVFDGVTYVEAYDSAASGGAHRSIRLIQTLNGVSSRRLQVDASTGDMTFYRRDAEYPSETAILTIKETGKLIFNLSTLPTADPTVAGELYSNGTPSASTPKALFVSGG